MGWRASAPDFACIFANVALFTVVQCFFYWFIASEQFVKLVDDKLNILRIFLDMDRPGKPLWCEDLRKRAYAVDWVATERDGRGLYEPKRDAEKARLEEVKASLRAGTRETTAYLPGLARSQVIEVETADGTTAYYSPSGPFVPTLSKKELKAHNFKTICTWAGLFVITSTMCLLLSLLAGKDHWKSHHTLGMVLVLFCFSTELLFYFGVMKTYQAVGDWNTAVTAYKKMTSPTE